MNSPEASIEEILASIRKTFTDEPSSSGASSASAGPAVASGAAEQRGSGMPSFRSAAEASAAELARPAIPTPPRSRAALIDEDLDDLIDTPVARSAASPSPAPSPASSGVSPVEAAREKWANLLNPHAANGASAKPIEAKIESPPQASPPPSTPTGLFAPRKGGFYPPQPTARTEPNLPMPSATPSSAAAPSPAAPAAVASEPARPAASFGAPPAPVAAAVIAPEPPAPRPGFIPFTQAPTPAPVSAPAAIVPEPVVAPAPASPVATPVATPAPAPVAEVPTASARALDDLVAGLNSVAQTASEPVVAPVPVLADPAPAAPLTVEAAPRTAPSLSLSAGAPSVGAPSVGTSSEPAAPAASVRSFEDVVADMLRPLLEKWIDENMPRIVERALQRDAALGRKPGV